MSISYGGYCKNQTFVSFSIECIYESILDGFWVQVRGNFGLELEFRGDFESNCYEVWFLRGAEGILLPPPLNFLVLGPQWEGSGREPHTLHPPPAKAYGVGGLAVERVL